MWFKAIVLTAIAIVSICCSGCGSANDGGIGGPKSIVPIMLVGLVIVAAARIVLYLAGLRAGRDSNGKELDERFFGGRVNLPYREGYRDGQWSKWSDRDGP